MSAVGDVVTRTLRLAPVGPHDGPRLLAFVGTHAVPGVETWDGTSWVASLRLPGGPATAQVTVAAGEGFDVRLRLHDRRDEQAAVVALTALLDLDRDVTPAQEHLGHDPLLGSLVARRPGLRAPGVLDPFETLVRTVVGQQISVAGARTVTARLVATVGDPLPDALHAPGVTHLFPEPVAVAGLDPDGPALAMPRARARAVVACAGLFASTAGGLPTREDLLAVPGIGSWTADYLDLRARRDPDVLLLTDLAVRRQLATLGLEGSPAVLRRATMGWSPHRSTALMHLWAEYLHL